MSSETSSTLVPYSFADGVRAAAPVMLGYLPLGFAFGVLARTAGLSPMEVAIMSILVYAGSGQFIGAGMIGAGIGAPAVVSAVFLVNLRHLLMSTALVPSLRQNKPWQNALLSHGITDETFAVNTAILQGRPVGPGFVAGLHIASHSTWITATVVGALAGQMVGNTEALGLDFALSAMFIGLLVPNLSGKELKPRMAAALVAAATAVGTAVLFPGSNWSVVGATVLAATVGVILSK